MARTATLTGRPPETIAPMSTAVAEVAAEALEMANYAVITSRQVIFHFGELLPGLAFGFSGTTNDVYYLPAWIDEDVYELEFIAVCDVPVANDCRVEIDDGTGARQTTLIDSGTPSGSVDWVNVYAPISGQGQVRFFTISVHKTTVNHPTYLRSVQLRAKSRLASTLPAPEE